MADSGSTSASAAVPDDAMDTAPVDLSPNNQALFFVDGSSRSSDFVDVSSGGFHESVSGKFRI